MKPTTKRENTDLSSLYDKIFNERMSTIQEQEEENTGKNVAAAASLKAEVEKLKKSGQEIPADVENAEREATKTIKTTVKGLKNTTTNG